jgi:hypothetical protein
VLSEELIVIDPNSPLWSAARPYLDLALRLERSDDNYSWHGWQKHQVEQFLNTLPARCSLVIGVWETLPTQVASSEHEPLILGVACEVVEGQVCSIRTFEALTAAGLKPTTQLEPGIDDALEIMRLVRAQVAPVAWALFTDKATWDEWLFTGATNDRILDKGEMLATLARQGRCVLLGSQNSHHH